MSYEIQDDDVVLRRKTGISEDDIKPCIKAWTRLITQHEIKLKQSMQDRKGNVLSTSKIKHIYKQTYSTLAMCK